MVKRLIRKNLLNQNNEKMDSSLSIVVTRNSKSKHCHASVYNRSMQSTTTTQQTITETIEHDVLGAEVSTWSGTNITPSGAIGATDTTYSVTTGATEWDLSITTRDAGTIETISIDRTIETDSTTNSYSIFAQ